ncbi:MAG: cytochrome c [Planctomycetota bacterium]|nr:MAG: cytochrome c [Planctomycetota bacterium]
MAQLFPKWTNKTPRMVASFFGVGAVGATLVVWKFFAPGFLWAGYRPQQPVPYSHLLHVGQLGLDCRYCHTGVERGAKAAVPPAATCMNCHRTIRADSPLLAPIREAAAGGKAVEWVKVHGLADYVYFDHSRHVNAGIGCVSCHGRIDQMEVVRQVAPLSMFWCLDCHRAPENHLRPREHVTSMDWKAEPDQRTLGLRLKQERGINPPQHCSACHR